MNTLIRSEWFLLLVAAGLFAMVVLQFTGDVDFVREINKYI